MSWCSEKSEKPKGKGPAEASTEPIKVTIRNAQSFAPFSRAVQQSWKSLSAKRQKKINPVLWGTLGKERHIKQTPHLLNLCVQCSGSIKERMAALCHTMRLHHQICSGWLWRFYHGTAWMDLYWTKRH